MQEVIGLFTCDECGAAVSADGTSTHIKWHEDLNERLGLRQEE